MVKNAKGGNKSKKMGRKFISAPIEKKTRLSNDECEIYAVVTKLLGNGMFNAKDTTGNEILCIIRRKFKTRGKRDNTVIPGGWVLVGKRDFESCAKPKHDLLEVYNEFEKQKLKKSGNPIFSKLKSEFDKDINDIDDNDDNDDNQIIFEHDESYKYQDLIKEVNNKKKKDDDDNKKDDNKTIMDEDEDETEVDFDDI